MDFRALREYCTARPGVTEDFPFGETTLVFKVMGKIFALTDVEALPLRVNLKCDPDWAIQLRERFPEVQPGYHMNKNHWNTVDLEGDLSDEQVREMIDHSYERVVRGLPRRVQEELSQA
jgi:predicted DNA-binding protein (MmcQ/YjbR family)